MAKKVIAPIVDLKTMMEELHTELSERFPAHFVQAHMTTNLGEHGYIRFALEPQSEWKYGYFENSTYLTISIFNIDQFGNTLKSGKIDRVSAEIHCFSSKFRAMNVPKMRGKKTTRGEMKAYILNYFTTNFE